MIWYNKARKGDTMSISYPKGAKRPIPLKHTPTFSSRGMHFEEMINQSNLFYLDRGMAVIHKKPTPIQIVQVDYPKRSAVKITEAYYKEASTTDYNGVYKGYYIDFEAKATQLLTRFPLDNIKAHQLDHMKACQKQGGISFVLVYFTKRQECYLLPLDFVARYYDQQENGRKSIPYEKIQAEAFLVHQQVNPRLDFLPAVDQYISIKGEYYEN